MKLRLEDKIALITGASRGQGEAEARLFASEGAKVLICDILDDKGQDLAEDIRSDGHIAEYFHLDVSNEEDWQNAINYISKKFGGLNVLVNKAGIGLRKNSILDISAEEWKKVLDINLTGTFFGIKTAAPVMKDSGSGSIINIGSIA